MMHGLSWISAIYIWIYSAVILWQKVNSSINLEPIRVPPAFRNLESEIGSDSESWNLSSRDKRAGCTVKEQENTCKVPTYCKDVQALITKQK